MIEPPQDPGIVPLQGAGALAPRAFNVLAKPTGARCNLDCAYCFFLSKEMLYPGSRFRMSDEQLDAYLRQLIEAHAGLAEVTIAWQGGEPTLMGLDFFQRSVELARKHLQPGQRAIHTIQTNGTLIDAEWAAFFKQNDYLVGISIDGPREIHDTYRVTKGGRGSFQRVMRGLDHLRAASVEFNTLTTLHAANAERGAEVYRFLRDDCGARFMQFIPIVERVPDASLDGTLPWSSWRDRPLYLQRGEGVTGRSIGAEQYGRFLIDVFEEWVRRDVGSVFVQMFDVALANWIGQPPGLCVHRETCGLGLALEHNGDLYSCDHYVEPGHRLGNICETPMVRLLDSPRQRQFGRAKREKLPRQCLDCEVRFACHGGCPKNRFVRAADGEGRFDEGRFGEGRFGEGRFDEGRFGEGRFDEGRFDEGRLNYLCDGYKAFFGHVDQPMRIMGELLARGRAPSEIARIYAAQDAKRPRNSPCTCGSGRKWKHCHGNMRATAPASPRASPRPHAR